MTRVQVRQFAKQLRPSKLPPGQRLGGAHRTSGTTGQPVEIVHTYGSLVMSHFQKQRELRWFRFDPDGVFAQIRPAKELPRGRDGEPPAAGQTVRLAAWPLVGPYFLTGPFLGLSDMTEIEDQVSSIEHYRPNYILAQSAKLEHMRLAYQTGDASRSPDEHRPRGGRRPPAGQPAHPDRPAAHRRGGRGAAGVAVYAARTDGFLKRWQDTTKQWERRAASLRGRRYVVHHAEWVYLFDWLGLQTAGAIEPKPGLPPAAGHLAALKQQLAARRADGIVRSPLSDPKAAEWLATETGLAVIELPQTVGATADAGSLFALFDAILGRLSGSRR